MRRLEVELQSFKETETRLLERKNKMESYIPLEDRKMPTSLEEYIQKYNANIRTFIALARDEGYTTLEAKNLWINWLEENGGHTEMKIEKIITTTQAVGINVTEITLLSIEEAKEVNENTRCIHNNWWLRSPGNDTKYAAYITCDGDVYEDGFNVDYSHFGVRPALKIRNMNSKLNIGDAIIFAEKKWTVINDTTVLCDSIIGESCFRNDWGATDANDYEASDIKKFLEAWKENECRKEKNYA